MYEHRTNSIRRPLAAASTAFRLVQRGKGLAGLGLLAAIALAGGGCAAPGQTVTSVTHAGPSLGAVQAQPYDGPKARIAVGDFSVKAAGATHFIGDGLREMLVTALFCCDRFIVLERQAINDVILEQDFGASGRVNPETAPLIGEVEGAELLVYGTVSEFDPDTSGVGLNLGVTRLPLSLGGSAKNAHLAIDLRVADTVTGRVLYAGRVEGKTSDYQGGLSTRLGGGSSQVPLALSGYKGTPMEKAVRACIDAAVAHVATQTPAEYFRY